MLDTHDLQLGTESPLPFPCAVADKTKEVSTTGCFREIGEDKKRRLWLLMDVCCYFLPSLNSLFVCLQDLTFPMSITVNAVAGS